MFVPQIPIQLIKNMCSGYGGSRHRDAMAKRAKERTRIMTAIITLAVRLLNNNCCVVHRLLAFQID